MTRPLGRRERFCRVHCTARRVLVAVQYGATFGEIVATTHRPRSRVYMALRALIADGAVRKPRPNWYEATA